MGGFSNLGSVYVEVGADLSALARELQGAVGEAAAAGQQIGQSLEQGIAQGAAPAAEGIKGVGNAAIEAEGGLGGLKESLIGVAEVMGIGLGIAEGIESIKALAEESIDAYGKIQLATVALTALTGSAEAAESVLMAMRGLALGSIFSLPELDQAAQKMAAIGVAAESIPPAMKAVVDAAEGTGNGLDAVSSALDRIYLSATISPRTLTQLGISMNDLADTMGMSADKVKEAFQALGPQSDDALQLLTATIEKRMAGAGDAVKGTLPNAINALKVQWDILLEDVGENAAGPFQQGVEHISMLTASIDALLQSLSGSKSGGVSVGGVLKAMGEDLASGFGLFGAATEISSDLAVVIGTLTGKYKSLQEGVAAVDAQVKGSADNWIANDALMAAQIISEGELADKTAASAAAARAALAARQADAAEKKLVTESTTALNEAESILASSTHAAYIPAIMDLDQAEINLEMARRQRADDASKVVAAEQALKDAMKLGASGVAEQTAALATLKAAHDTLKTDDVELKEREQDLTVSKKAVTEATNVLAAADKESASAMKTIAEPAIISYEQALMAVSRAKQQVVADDVALKAAQKAYSDYVAGDGIKNEGMLADLSKAVSDAYKQQATDAAAVKTAETNLNTIRNDSVKIAKALLDGNTALQTAYTKFAPTIKDLDSQLLSIQQDQKDLTQAESDEYDALANLQALKDAGLTQGAYVDQQLGVEEQARGEVSAATRTLSADIQQLAKDYGISYAAAKLLADIQNASTPAVQTLADAYAAAGIKTTASLQAEEAAANAAYKAITQDPTAGLQQKLQALQKEIDAEIALGQSVPADQQIQLAKMTQQETDYINNSAKRWTDLSNSIHADVQGMFSGLITDLFTGGDFIATIEKTLQTIGEQVVSAIFKPFTDLISQTISSLITPLAKTLAGWISDALTAIFPSLAGALGGAVGATATAANTAAVTANTAALAALTAALGADTATSAAGTAAGTAGSVGSSVGGAIGSTISGAMNVVTGAISAVTGIISVIQGFTMEGKLASIEQNTRTAAIYLGGDQSTGGITQIAWQIKDAILYGFATKDLDDIKAMMLGGLTLSGTVMGILGDIKDAVLFGPATKDLDDIKSYLGQMLTMAGGSTASPGLMASPNFLPSPQNVPMSIPSPADWLAGLSSMKMMVNLDGRELWASFVQFSEDNGLVIPQS